MLWSEQSNRAVMTVPETSYLLRKILDACICDGTVQTWHPEDSLTLCPSHSTTSRKDPNEERHRSCTSRDPLSTHVHRVHAVTQLGDNRSLALHTPTAPLCWHCPSFCKNPHLHLVPPVPSLIAATFCCAGECSHHACQLQRRSGRLYCALSDLGCAQYFRSPVVRALPVLLPASRPSPLPHPSLLPLLRLSAVQAKAVNIVASYNTESDHRYSALSDLVFAQYLVGMTHAPHIDAVTQPGDNRPHTLCRPPRSYPVLVRPLILPAFAPYTLLLPIPSPIIVTFCCAGKASQHPGQLRRRSGPPVLRAVGPGLRATPVRHDASPRQRHWRDGPLRQP